jgi:hypothetical protein
LDYSDPAANASQKDGAEGMSHLNLLISALQEENKSALRAAASTEFENRGING